MREAKSFALGLVLIVVFVAAGFALGYQVCESNLKMKYARELRDATLKMKAEWDDLKDSITNAREVVK